MNRIDTTLEVLIVQLNNLLRDAAQNVSLAETAIANGHRNQAIGALLPSERAVHEAASIMDAILAVHRAAAPVNR